jgi:SIR2-like domain
MPPSTLDRVPWSTLVDQVKAKRCTPFIGAGASAGVIPLGGPLAERLLEQEEKDSGKRAPLPDRRDLPKVSQYLAVTRQMGSWPKQKIADLISPIKPSDSSEPMVHRVLAELDLPIYLTTNYDLFMSDALARNPRKQVNIEHTRWTPELLASDASAFDSGYTPTAMNPVVFHLHGSVNNPESMVASEDDYLDFLVSISRDLSTSPTQPGQRTVLPLPIRTAIRNTTLLFIGYSLNDVNFRVILRGLLGSLTRGARRISMAVQYSEGNAVELEQWLEQYFLWSLDLQVYWGSAADFATTLRDKMSSP